MKKIPHIVALTCLLILIMVPIKIIADTTSVPARLAPESLLLGAATAGDALIVVGERGHVLRSTDQGQSWQQILVPTRATLTAVTFADHLHGLAVGHDLTILRTDDGGLNWQLAHEDPDEQPPFLDVVFYDRQLAFAVGAYGTFFDTVDGGETWEQRWINEDDLHLNAVGITDDAVYIAAEAGRVYRSEDQGETFTELAPDYEGSFFGILPIDNDNLLLFGLRGNLFFSPDKGATWHEIHTQTDAGLTCGLQLSDGTLIIAGLGGALLIVDEENRRAIARQEPDRKGFSKLVETAGGTVLAVGDFGVTLLPQQTYH